MALTRTAPNPIRLVNLLTGREAVSRLTSFWFFLVASLVCLIGFVYGSGFQQSFVTESVMVTTDPLMLLNIVVVVFIGLVLGLRLATAIAWEREHRTLEVLLVGPVTWSMVIVSKFIVEFLVAAALAAIYCLYLTVAQPLGAGVITLADSAAVAEMGLFVLPLMATGLLVSAWAGTVRSAVVIYLVAATCLAAFEAAIGVLQNANPEDMSLSALYVRSALEAVSPVLSPISPFGSVAMMIRQSYAQAAIGPGEWLLTIGLTCVFLAVAILVARSRGAQ